MPRLRGTSSASAILISSRRITARTVIFSTPPIQLHRQQLGVWARICDRTRFTVNRVRVLESGPIFAGKPAGSSRKSKGAGSANRHVRAAKWRSITASNAQSEPHRNTRCTTRALAIRVVPAAALFRSPGSQRHAGSPYLAHDRNIRKRRTPRSPAFPVQFRTRGIRGGRAPSSKLAGDAARLYKLFDGRGDSVCGGAKAGRALRASRKPVSGRCARNSSRIEAAGNRRIRGSHEPGLAGSIRKRARRARTGGKKTCRNWSNAAAAFVSEGMAMAWDTPGALHSAGGPGATRPRPKTGRRTTIRTPSCSTAPGNCGRSGRKKPGQRLTPALARFPVARIARAGDQNQAPGRQGSVQP